VTGCAGRNSGGRVSLTTLSYLGSWADPLRDEFLRKHLEVSKPYFKNQNLATSSRSCGLSDVVVLLPFISTFVKIVNYCKRVNSTILIYSVNYSLWRIDLILVLFAGLVG
jgi:hypothetical protein